MDLVLSLVKVVGQQLIKCKQLYNELGLELDRLTITVNNVRKLASDRSKESRLKGTIQDTMLSQLQQLSEFLDETIGERSGKAGKAKLFFGSCVGKGAKSRLTQLQNMNQGLQSTLDVADSEVMVVTASAAEEMAGGAAGRHIKQGSAREFWREQYKNELELSIERFFSGLTAYEDDFQKFFRAQLGSVRNCLTGRMDPNFDGTVYVTEFANFCSAATKRVGELPMLDLILASANGGQLKGAMLAGHTAPILSIDTAGTFVATGDNDGYLKVWILGQTTLVLLSTTCIEAAGKPVTYVRFIWRERLSLFAAAGGIVEVDVFSGRRISVIRDPHSTPISSISGEGSFVFSTARFPSAEVAIWRQTSTSSTSTSSTTTSSSNGGGVGSSSQNTRFEKYGVLGNDEHVIHYLVPLRDSQHLLSLSLRKFIALWNYKDLTLVRIIQSEITRGLQPISIRAAADANHYHHPQAPSASATPILAASYKGEKCEYLFDLSEAADATKPLKPPTKKDTVLPINEYPRCYVSEEYAAQIDGQKLTYVLLTHETLNVPIRREHVFPMCVRIQRVHTSEAGVVVVGLMGTVPAVFHFRITTCNEPSASNVSSDGIPSVIMSQGRWLAHKKASTSSAVTSSSHRHWVIPFVPPHLARLPSAQQEPEDLTLLSCCDSFIVQMFDGNLKLRASVNTRFTARRNPYPISCLAVTSDGLTVLVGNERGKLVKYNFAQTWIEKLAKDVEREEESRTKKIASGKQETEPVKAEEATKDTTAADQKGEDEQEKKPDPTPLPPSTGSDSAAILAPTIGVKESIEKMEFDQFKKEVLSVLDGSRKTKEGQGAYIYYAYNALARGVQPSFAEFKLELDSTPMGNIPEEIVEKLISALEMAKPPKSDKPFEARMEHFSSISCWQNPEEKIRINAGHKNCGGCMKPLQSFEVVQQICRDCASRRPDKKRCIHCGISYVQEPRIDCDSCYDERKTEVNLSIQQISIIRHSALLGCVAYSQAKAIQEGKLNTCGTLVALDIDSMVVSSREASYYIPTSQSIAGTEALGGMWAVCRYQQTINIFSSEKSATSGKIELKQNLLETFEVRGESLAVTVLFNESAILKRKAAKNTETPEGRVFAARGTPSPSQSLEASMGRSDTGSIPLLVGLTNGTVEIWSLRYGVDGYLMAEYQQSVHIPLKRLVLLSINQRFLAMANVSGTVIVLRAAPTGETANGSVSACLPPAEQEEEEQQLPGRGSATGSRARKIVHYYPVIKVQASSNVIASCLFFHGKDLFLSCDDGCLNKFPLQLFEEAEKMDPSSTTNTVAEEIEGCDDIKLLLPLDTSDSFCAGPHHQYLSLNSEWMWKAVYSSSLEEEEEEEDFNWSQLADTRKLLSRLTDTSFSGGLELHWTRTCLYATVKRTAAGGSSPSSFVVEFAEGTITQKLSRHLFVARQLNGEALDQHHGVESSICSGKSVKFKFPNLCEQINGLGTAASRGLGLQGILLRMSFTNAPADQKVALCCEGKLICVFLIGRKRQDLFKIEQHSEVADDETGGTSLLPRFESDILEFMLPEDLPQDGDGAATSAAVDGQLTTATRPAVTKHRRIVTIFTPRDATEGKESSGGRKRPAVMLLTS